MYLIVGLGNPGDKYNKTRHNIGFDFIDEYSKNKDIKLDNKKFKAIYGSGTINGEKIILAKPQTFMNLSGESVVELLNFYKIPIKNLIVVYDDVSLDVGNIRIRAKGSSGGQNGMKNIINLIGSDEFIRIKIGVGLPKHDLVTHVLSKFDKEERENINSSIEKSSSAMDLIIKGEVSKAQTLYN